MYPHDLENGLRLSEILNEPTEKAKGAADNTKLFFIIGNEKMTQRRLWRRQSTEKETCAG